MNKVILLIFLSALILSCNKKIKQENEEKIQIESEPTEKIIGIYVQNQKYDYQDVIIIGEIKSDSIYEITDWDDEKRDYVENRLPYLKKYDKYYIDNFSKKETIILDTIRKKDFQCSELTVGHSNKYNLNIENEFSICSNSKNFKNFKLEDNKEITSKSYSIVKDKLRKALKDNGVNVTSGFDNNYQTTFKEISVDILQSIDLNNDGIDEFIIQGSIEEDYYTKNSVILVFNITDDYIKDVGKINTWSKGYNLIGVTDLNNNEKFELIFQGIGYESIGFEIYEITNNGFKKLLSTVPYGC